MSNDWAPGEHNELIRRHAEERRRQAEIDIENLQMRAYPPGYVRSLYPEVYPDSATHLLGKRREKAIKVDWKKEGF